MEAVFEIFKVDEGHILNQLDDDLFLGHLTKEELMVYQDTEPSCEIDVIVKAALKRALRLSIPDGLNGTIYRKGTKEL